MKSDTSYPYFHEYASQAQYPYTNTHSSDDYARGSEEGRKQVGQSEYNLRNLPIIYTNDHRGATPSKQAGSSSRIVYESRTKLLKYQPPSGISQCQILPPIQPKAEQINPLLHQRPAQLIHTPYPITEAVQNSSRILLESSNGQPPFSTKTVTIHRPQISFHNQNFQTTSTSNTQINPGNIIYNSESRGRLITNPSQNMEGDTTINVSSKLPQARIRQINSLGLSPDNHFHRPMPSGMSQLSLQTVPKVQFDRCVNECKNWQTKYNQLYLKYMNLATTASEPKFGELEELKQENWRLKQQLKQKEEERMGWVSMAEGKFASMVNTQKEATVRECMLLMERFRLETRHTKF